MNELTVKSAAHHAKLEELIKQSNYPGLVTYVEQLSDMQESILHFDNPSLVLLAVELYLNPSNITNPEYQFEIIVFLLKCGLSIFVPRGTVILYLMNKAGEWGITDEKLYQLFKTLIDYGKTEILLSHLPGKYYYNQFEDCYDYLLKHRSAIIIQRCWRLRSGVVKN